ncbi:hypothetical protein EDB92DRAFT_1838414 [Lactarius akahatsu]|uniref:Uncharacterized protein n=1 Tax=Lactarius akahatsu TaxID=416441 RepID=A0AAD4LMD8_9AGAM|nr:hypothetical protein EDB92DRAFT_1838414 [Lactarius akahatsu]
MDQVWYDGTIARTTGDIGIELAMTVTALLYIPLRHLANSGVVTCTSMACRQLSSRRS